MSYEAILFDMNGVIVNDEPLHLAAFQAVIGEHGQTLTEEQYKQYFAGRTDKDGFEDYTSAVGLQDNIDQLMNDKAQAYLSMAQETLTPYPGIIDFIIAIGHTGTPIALVTSSLRKEAAAVLSTFEITDKFAAVITADDIKIGKPDPEGYLLGARALGVEPTHCLVVEDAPSGVKAAKAAGMTCLAVLNTHNQVELADADMLVERLDSTSLDLLK